MKKILIYLVMLVLTSCLGDVIYPLNEAVLEYRPSSSIPVHLVRTETPNTYVGKDYTAVKIGSDTRLTKPDGSVLVFHNGRTENDRSRINAEYSKIDNKRDVWFQTGRLRIKSGNPNVLGAVLAEVFVLFMFMVSARRNMFKKTCWLALAGISAYLMACTGSRGAFLAAFIGCIVVFYRSLANVKLFAAAATGMVIAFCLYMFVYHPERVSGDSIRLDMFKIFPAMFKSAPFGWGNFETGHAVAMWFTDKFPSYISENLISGHLTVMTRFGWAFSAMYISAWMLLFYVFRKCLLVEAELLVLSTACVINPCVCIECIIVPLCAALACFRKIRRPSAVAVLTIFCISLITVCCIISIGFKSEKRIHTDGKTVHYGDNPEICIVDDGMALSGGYWWMTGLAIRNESKRTCRDFIWTDDVLNIPAGFSNVVVVGKTQCDKFKQTYGSGANGVKTLTFIAPGSICGPSDYPESYFTVIVGGLDSTAAGYSTGDFAEIVPGSYLYIPGWFSKCLL